MCQVDAGSPGKVNTASKGGGILKLPPEIAEPVEPSVHIS